MSSILDTKGLGAQHISSNLENYEAARSGFFNFYFEISGLNLVKATYTGDPANAPADAKLNADNSQEYVMLNVVSCDVPHFSVEQLTYRRGNEVVHFAGTPTFNGGKIVVDDVVGLNTKDILMALQAKTYNIHSGKGGRMSDYKFTGYLIEYTQDYVPLRKWKTIGCFITELSEDSFNKENDSKRQINVTFSYDRAIPQEIDQ